MGFVGALVRTFYYGEAAETAARRISTGDRLRIANNIAADARQMAPVLTGAYRDGIKVEQRGLLVSVVDDDPEAFYKEYGTSDTPAHAALTNAARKYGEYSGYQPGR